MCPNNFKYSVPPGIKKEKHSPKCETKYNDIYNEKELKSRRDAFSLTIFQSLIPMKVSNRNIYKIAIESADKLISELDEGHHPYQRDDEDLNFDQVKNAPLNFGEDDCDHGKEI